MVVSGPCLVELIPLHVVVADSHLHLGLVKALLGGFLSGDQFSVGFLELVCFAENLSDAQRGGLEELSIVFKVDILTLAKRTAQEFKHPVVEVAHIAVGFNCLCVAPHLVIGIGLQIEGLGNDRTIGVFVEDYLGHIDGCAVLTLLIECTGDAELGIRRIAILRISR